MAGHKGPRVQFGTRNLLVGGNPPESTAAARFGDQDPVSQLVGDQGLYAVHQRYTIGKRRQRRGVGFRW
jgi:hypothetical protein